jgi:hypothetical protein
MADVPRRAVPSSALLVAASFAAIVASGCSGDDDTTATTAVTLPEELPVTAAVRPADLAVPLCVDLPDPADSLDWSGPQRSEVPDPLRTGAAVAAALQFPYAVDVWGGTGDHEGWIVVGVSGGAVELQQLLDLQFPGARVLAMPLDWTYVELTGLAALVDDATASLSPPADRRVSMSQGLVRVDLGAVTEERADVLREFADDRVCIDGDL